MCLADSRGQTQFHDQVAANKRPEETFPPPYLTRPEANGTGEREEEGACASRPPPAAGGGGGRCDTGAQDSTQTSTQPGQRAKEDVAAEQDTSRWGVSAERGGGGHWEDSGRGAGGWGGEGGGRGSTQDMRKREASLLAVLEAEFRRQAEQRERAVARKLSELSTLEAALKNRCVPPLPKKCSIPFSSPFLWLFALHFLSFLDHPFLRVAAQQRMCATTNVPPRATVPKRWGAHCGHLSACL